MKLLAVSGGPDSIFMLDLFKKNKIIVAHVNYHKREDSNIDEKIVRDFCKKHEIPIFVLDITEKHSGNFQEWAREKRYKFFKEIYDENKCNELLVAHHKDDFIETALMQQQSGRNPKYFGIKKYNSIFGMDVYRPLLNYYYKDEIIEILDKKNIKYAIDSSNSTDNYARNVVRKELKKMSKKEKNDIYKWFKMSNKILAKKNKKVARYCSFWEKTGYSLNFFRQLKKYKEEIIFETIHKNFYNVKLSSRKIESIIDFINGEKGNKEFKLNDRSFISKENKTLVFKEKK